MPKYVAYVRLLSDGMPSRPFSMATLDRQFTADPRRLRIIRNTSRHRYGQPARQVERQIAAAFG